MSVVNAPVPGPPVVDPDAVRDLVEQALAPVDVAHLDADGLAEQARSLDALHRSLTGALDTIDRV